MEPFELSLNQVNFETYNLGESDTDKEPLHSFSNLVSYDWDLKSSENDGPPVTAKKVVRSPDRESFIDKTDSAENSYSYSGDVIIHYLYSDSYDDASLSGIARNIEDEALMEYRAAKKGMMEQQLSSHSHSHKQVSLDESTGGSDAEETFRAFTETVEALALQKSVIGNANIKPASAEEIEKAISAAQAKMSQATLKCDHVQSKHSVAENGTESSSSLTTGPVADKSFTLDGTNSSDPLMRSPAGSQPHDLYSGDDVLRSGKELAKSSVADAESSHTSFSSKQLIRMSADNVVTESASRSGWFWSKKSPEHSSKTKVAPGPNTSPTMNVPKPKPKSSAQHKELSERNDKHECAAVDGHARLTNSSVSGRRDANDVSSSISASTHDHSPLKPSSNDSPATSTPVRGNSGFEKYIETRPAQLISSSSDVTKRLVDVVPSSPHSPASVLPETPVKSPTTAEASLSSSSSIQSVTVSTTRGVVATPTVSRQSLAGNAEFDEGRYEMLMRENAGLEGRLEVLERENSDMLRLQTELKQRAAMAEQQVKTLMSSSQALNADRNAMAVDLETLRQNRARLEVVIVDAHKLLEEKEQEMRTLERDLELARLAGEKHLEKVADVRREAASRDVTVRDLKAKITELYVQSQTSEQTRQVVEGELAVVRADVTALMEAKEWYANQLQATQKDRSRLQQESAASRAETITANVASERLRAENARAKRNLTEVAQRMLTEKQTLARHLEEIEADMLAREAALTVQLREDKESSSHSTSVPSSHDETEELSHLKAELQRTCEKTEMVQRENVELSRRLALSQQCVIDRDETVTSLERDRESAEVRAEAVEQNVALRVADVQRLESERSELQLQLESASKERHMIDQSLQTLRRDTAVLETSFRRMQQDLAAKTAEIEKLSLLKERRRSEEQLSEVWPDTEAAAGLMGRKEMPKSAVDGLVLSKITFADKEIQSDELVETVDGLLTHELKGTRSVSMVTADTQTEEPMAAVVAERAEKLLRVDDVVLQSDVVSSAVETLATVTDSRIIEHSQQLSSDSGELASTDKSVIIDKLNAELASVRACLSNVQQELEVANRHWRALESEKLMQLSNDSTESLVFNTSEDSVRISSISDSMGKAGDIARVHSTEKKSIIDQHREVQLQTDEVFSQSDELRQQLEMQLTTLQHELDIALNEKLQLETAKATVKQEASATAERLAQVEKLLQQTQEDLVRLEQQLSEADSKSLKVHNSTVEQLEGEKLLLQSQLDELTSIHHRDVSRLKSKNLKLSKQLESAAVDQRDEVNRLETRIQELVGELALATETKTRLEMQFEELRTRASLDADQQMSQLQQELQKCYTDFESSNVERRRLETELNSAESEHQLAMMEYRQHVEDLSRELRTLQVVVEEQRGRSDEAALMALELEKDRGRLAALEQTHAALRQHAASLEAALAERASSEMESDSAAHDELRRRDQQVAELAERVEQLEQSLSKEQQTTKDVRAQLMTEKGNHIKVRRQLEQVTSEHTQLVADSTQLRDTVAELTSNAESFAARELELKMTADRLTAELRAASADRDRLTHELDDRRVRDAAVQDNVDGLEWRLSEKDAEITAAKERLEMVEQRQAMEMHNLTQSVQSATAELSKVQDELVAIKKERSSLQSKVVQLTTALKSVLAAKVNLSVATETTAELERMLQDVSATPYTDSKPLSFLQATLNGLRGEISCLQTQMSEHTSAVHTSSLAWRELEAQVQDLREVCKTSAADRAAAASQRQPPSPQSTIHLPETGPVVIPGKLANVTSHDSSPHNAASTS